LPTETEIKIRISDLDGLRARIGVLGYSEKVPRTLESDRLYDRDDQELRRSGRIVRLRTRGTHSTLTYKGPAERGPHKSREELEVDLSDGAMFERILDALGYKSTFRYQKYRTTFSREGEPGLITWDETPIGAYMELEGDAEWIDRTAVALGFGVQDYITASYATLYREHCSKNPSAVPDAMVF
jgi:adenylate cyclase class 2